MLVVLIHNQQNKMREIKIKQTDLWYYIFRQKEVAWIKRTRYRTWDNRFAKSYEKKLYLTEDQAIAALYRARKVHKAQLDGEIFTTIPKNEIISWIDSWDYLRYN